MAVIHSLNWGSPSYLVVTNAMGPTQMPLENTPPEDSFKSFNFFLINSRSRMNETDLNSSSSKPILASNFHEDTQDNLLDGWMDGWVRRNYCGHRWVDFF